MSIMHISTNIQGLLNNCRRKGSLDGVLVGADGRHISDAEARTYLRECLAKGYKYLPATGCDNFDYQTGCKGHRKEDYADVHP